MVNIKRRSQDDQSQPHRITPVPPSISLETSLYLKEKLNSKSIQRSLLSKGVSQRRLKEDLRKRRHRRSLSITHSFDVLRSRLLNYMGFVTFGENTNQNREKELEDRQGLNDIG